MYEKLSSAVDKNWTTWWEFDDIYNTRAPLISWNWVPTIFFWAQRGCTCTKSVLYLSSYSQYSRCITGPILWSSEWFISMWYCWSNVTFSVLVSCAWIIPTTTWIDF